MRLRKLTVIAIMLVSSLLWGCRSANKHLDEAANRGEAAYKQYKESDYATAKAALLDYTSYLDALARYDPTTIQMCENDAMVSYVRLAKLEEKNHGSEKDRYMADAATRCGKLAIKRDCSAGALRSMVDAIDRVAVK